jgi:transcription elongation factor Elf1
MKNNEKTTYKVRLLCRNCNNDWEFEVAKGTYVRSEKDNNYMIKRGEKKKKYFNCPKCGANKKIARLPLV